MKIRYLAAILLLAALSAPWSAMAGTVGGYPNANALTGNERILADQSSVGYPCVACTVNITPAQIVTYLGTLNLTLPSITGQNGCLFTNGTTIIWTTGGCGGGGAPGGSNYQLQWNNAGGFAGISLGTLGYPLLSGGSGAAPAFGQLDLTLGVTNILPQANGGTGNASGYASGMVGTLANGTFWGVSGGVQGWYTPTGSGTVNSGTTNQVGCYSASGTAISGCTTLPTAAIPALSGDVTSPGGSTAVTVTRWNGGVIPANANCVSTNSSAQPSAGCPEAVQVISASTYSISAADCGRQDLLENAGGVTVTVTGGGTFTGCQIDFGVPSGFGTSTLSGSSVTIGGHSSVSMAVDRQCGINFDGANWGVIGCTALTVVAVSGITGLGTGVGTFLATPTAANLGSAVTGAGNAAGQGIAVSGTWPTQTIASSYSTRVVSGATDTILSTDCANGVNYTFAGSVAVTLPQATGSFAGCGVDISAASGTTVTITPTTSTINGAATAVVGPSLWDQVVAVSGNYNAYGTGVSFAAGVTYLLDEGTKFTIASGTGACATTTTLTGGTAIGSFVCSGTSGASTAVITLPTAPNGIWICKSLDKTTPADTFVQTTWSSTSATLGGTIVSGDVIGFSCSGS